MARSGEYGKALKSASPNETCLAGSDANLPNEDGTSGNLWHKSGTSISPFVPTDGARVGGTKKRRERPGQRPLLPAEPFVPLEERLRQAFPIGETPEQVVGHKLTPDVCLRVLRYFRYPVWVFHSRVMIGEPPFYGDADALRLINRVLLWVLRNEHEIVRDARWFNLTVVGKLP